MAGPLTGVLVSGEGLILRAKSGSPWTRSRLWPLLASATSFKPVAAAGGVSSDCARTPAAAKPEKSVGRRGSRLRASPDRRTS